MNRSGVITAFLILVCGPSKDGVVCRAPQTYEQLADESQQKTNADLADREREIGIKPGITEQQEIDLLKDRITVLEDDLFLMRGKDALKKK